MTVTNRQNGYTPTTPAAPGFGSTLRFWREDAGLSQVNLAFDVGCDRSYIHRLESGNRKPSREMVTDIAYALKLPDVERVGLYAAAGMIAPGLACTVIVTGGRVTLVGQGGE